MVLIMNFEVFSCAVIVAFVNSIFKKQIILQDILINADRSIFNRKSLQEWDLVH